MFTIPRLWQIRKRDEPIRARAQPLPPMARFITLDVPYLTGRQWIALDCLSRHTFDFNSVRGVRVYGADHPWRWRVEDDYQRIAAEQLQAQGIVIPGPSERGQVQLSVEGFIRAAHGAWGDDKIALVCLKETPRR